MERQAVRRQAFGRFAGFTLVTAATLFVPAGTLRWWNGWVFVVVGLGLISVLTGAVFARSPDLVQERLTAGAKAKGWDQVLVPLLAAVLPFASNILAGLDRRLGWTRPFALPVPLAALGVMVAGIVLTAWAMRTNPFFSSHVRIQHDRGHVVVRGGPYAYLRHPGYTGALVYNLAAPLLLGSLVAFGVGVAMALVFVLRTALEDATLQRELDGYREYAGSVRYRLVPFVW